MLTRSRVIGDASALCGEPADEPLPQGVPHHLRYSLAADIETELTRDLNLSVQNRTMAKSTVYLNPGTREFSLSQFGLENPVYVALTRLDTPNVIPEPVDISNVAVIDVDAREGKRTAAFYGDKPQRGIVSWNPGGNETLLVWYDRSPATDPSPDQASFSITDSYVPLLKLMLAAQMLELMKQPIGVMLQARIKRGMEQWEDFVASGRQQGVVKKSVAYGADDRHPRSIYDTWPGRIRFE